MPLILSRLCRVFAAVSTPMGVAPKCLLSELFRRHIIQSAVWPLAVVVLPPDVQDLLRIGQRKEPVFVEAFRPQTPIERFYEAVVSGLPGRLKSSVTPFQ